MRIYRKNATPFTQSMNNIQHLHINLRRCWITKKVKNASVSLRVIVRESLPIANITVKKVQKLTSAAVVFVQTRRYLVSNFHGHHPVKKI